MSDPLSAEFDIEIDGERYTFRKPGIRYRIEAGYRAADVRRRAYPASGGALPGDFGIDRDAALFAHNCALLELYLVRSDQAWCFSPGDDGKPHVDFDKFPPDREDTVWRLGGRFVEEVSRFRTRGDTDKPPAGAKTVDSQ